jgi:DegV family protein with EDD domain
MKIAVMTDSTAYIPSELKEKYNIYMVPLSVVFGDVSYREEIDITTEDFYQKIKESENLPTTSQPSVGNILEKLEELSKDYDAVISIHLSSKISGTYSAVASVGEMVEGIKVYPFDTELSAMPQGFFAIEAAEQIKRHKTPVEIIEHLNQMKENTRAYFMVDDLTNLQRGGRLSGAQALIGSLLQIKPILHFVDGIIVPFEKIRTRKKAINRIIEMLDRDAAKGNIAKVVFIHANDEQSAIDLRDQFSKKYPQIETVVSYFGPVIGTHLGEKSLGISWYRNQ